MNSNGRVNISGPNHFARFEMHDKIPNQRFSKYTEALTGNWLDSNLSNSFFSANNMKILQMLYWIFYIQGKNTSKVNNNSPYIIKNIDLLKTKTTTFLEDHVKKMNEAIEKFDKSIEFLKKVTISNAKAIIKNSI